MRRVIMVAAGIGGLALVLVGFGAAHAELYFPPDPAIDTVFAPGYSEAELNVVTTGMTRADVVRLLGVFFKVPKLRPAAVTLGEAP